MATHDQQKSEPREPARKRGRFRRLVRLVAVLVFLFLGTLLTLPLWGSTGVGTGLLSRVASLATGHRIEADNLDLGYAGDVLVEGLRVGKTLTVERADLTIGLFDLTGRKIRLRGTITRPVYIVTGGPAAEPSEGGRRPPASPPSRRPSPVLPDAQVDLKIIEARVEIRGGGVGDETVDRIEGLDADVQITCDGSIESLTAELTTKWQSMEIGGFRIEPSELVASATPARLHLRPSRLHVGGGVVDVEAKLDLEAGAERLVCKLVADGVQPPDPDLQPIRGVRISADLAGLNWIRAALEQGELGVSHLEILRRLRGSMDVAVQQLSYRFAGSLPVVGNELTIRGLDGKLHLESGRIRTENMNMLVQDTAVSADINSTPEGPVSFSLVAGAPGQPPGRLPVMDLSVQGTWPFSGDRARVQATAARILYEGTEIRALDLDLDYVADGDGHRVENLRCALGYDGASIDVQGQASIDGAGSAAFSGTATLDGYARFLGRGPLQDLRAEVDLRGVPTSGLSAGLVRLEGKVDATVASLPTGYADLQNVRIGIDFAEGQANVRECSARSGGGNVSARATLFLGSSPAELTFRVKADAMTLDGAEAPLQNFAARGDLRGVALIQGLHQPALHGTITGSFDALPLSAVTLNKGKFEVGAQRGRMDVIVLDIAAGPGHLSGTGFVDLAQQPPEWRLEMNNDKVGVRKGYHAALSWVVPILSVPAGNLGGQLASTLELGGQGFGKEDLLRTMTGSGNLTLSEGFVSGSPILRELMPLVQGLDLVGIESIHASFEIGGGLVRSDDLDLSLRWKDSPIFLGLKGTVDFDTNIDYGVKLRTIERYLPVSTQPLLRLLGKDATIPLHLRGTIARPRVAIPSVEEILAEIGTSGLQRLAEDPLKLLDGLLGGDREREEKERR